jgi:hypothetical protein
MSDSLRTITTYSNGLKVYGNEGCRLKRRRIGHLGLVAFNPDLPARPGQPQEEGQCEVAPAPQPVCASAYMHDDSLEPSARQFCYWLEDRYCEGQNLHFGRQNVPIKVYVMPPPAVVDLAIRMLRQRGWIVTASREGTVNMNGTRSATFSLRQITG